MKLDISIIRSLMQQAEDTPAGKVLELENLKCDGHDVAVIAEHVKLLVEEKYIEALTFERIADNVKRVENITIHRLTMKGHEFIRNARNDTIWKKVTDDAKQKGIAMPVHLLNSALEKLASKVLGIE